MRKQTLLIISALFFFPQVTFAGTQTFTSSGTFTVPAGYTTLTVEVWGGGGGGAGHSQNGQPGGLSRFNTATPLTANGGGAGNFNGTGGVGGTWSGGTSGDNGDNGVRGAQYSGIGGKGGTAGGPAGGRGGLYTSPDVYLFSGFAGSIPGGGGSASLPYNLPFYGTPGQSGGGGGYTTKTYVAGQSGSPAAGSNITVTVGSGGAGGPSQGWPYNYSPGGAGARGEVLIYWTTATTGDHIFRSSGTFTVPSSFGTLTTQVWGGGGGGGSGGWWSLDDAGAGGNSTFASPTPVIGYGGEKGRSSSYCCYGGNGPGGAGGSYSGGGVGSEAGENGTQAGAVYVNWSGRGGDAGGPGGDGGEPVGPDIKEGYESTSRARSPGGGANGGGRGLSNDGGGGGGGGYAIKTFNYGELTSGANIPVTVGAGGNIGSGDNGPGGRNTWGDYGERGEVRISWTAPVTPTCTLSLNPNPINQGGSSTLTWSSTNATSFDITNVGPVDVPPGAGSTSVYPSATTVYTGTVNGPGGSGNCNVTLTVNPATTANLIGNGEADDTVTAFQNTSVSFSWSSTNATDCTLTKDPGTAPWSGSTTGVSGPSRTVGPYSSLGTYTYTLTCTGAGGSTAIDTVVVTVNPLDMCSDISGNQTILPGGCTGPDPSPVGACIPSGYYWSGTQCLLDVCTDISGGQQTVPTGCTGPNPSPAGACLPPGYTWNGVQCLAPLPTLTTGTFYTDRVRTGTASTLHWNLTDITGLTCTISPDPTDNVGTYAVGVANGTVGTIVITQTKSYTLTCTNGTNSGSVTATVNVLPGFQEI